MHVLAFRHCICRRQCLDRSVEANYISAYAVKMVEYEKCQINGCCVIMLLIPSTTTQLEDYPYSSSPGGWTQPGGVHPPVELVKPPSYTTSPPGAESVELRGASQQQYPGRVIQVVPATGSAVPVQSPPPAY